MSSDKKKAKGTPRRSGIKFKLLAVAVLIVLLAIFVDQHLHKAYVFDPQTLHTIALDAIKKHQNDSFDKLVRTIAHTLAAKYPGRINLEEEWVFNNAGGAMGQMYLLHTSLTEYVIIFGTPIGTDGHTGRFFADDYFVILRGEQWAFSEGSFEREVFKPGDLHHLPRGEAKAYRVPEEVFALEYARGWIPLMMPFGVADTLFSTLDPVVLGRTFWLYGKVTVQQLLQGKI